MEDVKQVVLDVVVEESTKSGLVKINGKDK